MDRKEPSAYLLAVGTNIEELEGVVNASVADGWRPLGGPAYMPATAVSAQMGYERGCVVQALIKASDEA